jgi:hypothetical protein
MRDFGTKAIIRQRYSPDMAGVRIPSPIAMQVPKRTRIRMIFFSELVPL